MDQATTSNSIPSLVDQEEPLTRKDQSFRKSADSAVKVCQYGSIMIPENYYYFFVKLTPTSEDTKNGLCDAQIEKHLKIAKFVREQAKLSSDKAEKKLVQTFSAKNPPSVYKVGESVLVKLYSSRSRKKGMNKYTRVITGRIDKRNMKQGTYKVSYELSGKHLHGWFKVTELTSLTKSEEKSRKSITQQVRNHSIQSTLTMTSLNNQPDQVAVPSKSDVTQMLHTDISINKGKFAVRVQALSATISSALEIWDDLYDVEKCSLYENVAYVTKIIGVKPSATVLNQLAVTSERPFMQFQGCSSYCGVSAINNALQHCAATVEKLDHIADNQWLIQIEEVGLTICDDLQKMRDIDGNYSVDVLKQATEDLGYEMVHLDNQVVAMLSQPLDANTTLNQLKGLITHHGPKSIIVADSRGKGIPHYSTILFSDSAVWHLNSLCRQPKVVDKKWMMKLLRDIHVAHSKVSLYTLQPLHSNPHSLVRGFEESYGQLSPSTIMEKYPPTASILVPPTHNNSLSSSSSIVYVSPVKSSVHGQLPVNTSSTLLEKGMLL